MSAHADERDGVEHLQQSLRVAAGAIQKATASLDRELRSIATAALESVKLRDQEIDLIAETMPGGLNGFLKGWGWRNFARAVEGEILSRAISAAARKQPTELELHRADYQAIQAAGFQDPGELLDAYLKVSAKNSRNGGGDRE